MEVYSNIPTEQQKSHSAQSQSTTNKLVSLSSIQSYSNHNLNIPTPKILLLEDTPILQVANMTLLKSLGCDVDLAKTGIDAIKMFCNGYHLIFLDIGLPDISGITVAKAIRSEEVENNSPRNVLIALTAFGEKMAEECLEAGMDDYYTKPILSEQLKQVLSKWLPFIFKTDGDL